jgi:hypothetical protein
VAVLVTPDSAAWWLTFALVALVVLAFALLSPFLLCSWLAWRADAKDRKWEAEWRARRGKHLGLKWITEKQAQHDERTRRGWR